MLGAAVTEARESDGDRVIARIRPTMLRRLVGVGTLAVLGGLLVYIGVAFPPRTILWQAFLVGLGALALWLAERSWRASAREIELTETELRDSAGTVICALDDIVAVERGAFAFKPSQGFLLRLSGPAPASWAPGLWWRLGRRVGIGGLTPGADARVVADALSAHVASRGDQSPLER